ncbi:hypothetical protein O0Q50_21160 [Priestia aryabhattai]|uniref:Uncharacterized protein n=1 Tax=Priestia aryabhattai TaxID=412384 RepID=A0AAX6ND01_PRIAR|nr:hypothetical protein [Priestia aryabhattai]MDU9693689.1 hypothetical protein [Priestia aryabhattai]
MSLEKLNEHIQQELQKREVSQDMANLQKEVYELVVIREAKINSLQEALAAVKFVGVESPILEEELNALRQQLKKDKAYLTEKVESLINNTFKEDFIKITKKTKFLQKELITHATFNKINEHTIHTPYVLNLLKESTNEELLRLSPYKIAELIQTETKYSQIRKFVELYKLETKESKIDKWITTFAKNNDANEHQQIRLHFTEVKGMLQLGFSTTEMLQDIAVQWSIRLGYSGDVKNDADTQGAVKEVVNILKEEAAIVI